MSDVNLSMTFTKTSISGGKLRWSAVCSDTAPDLANDEATVELFDSFIANMKSSGKMPYVSVAHYPDANVPSHLRHLLGERAIAGEVTEIYRDGNRLKAKGTFADTPLGHHTFSGVQDDIARNRPLTERARISIGFWDWEHTHGDMVFRRRSLDDSCPVCVSQGFRAPRRFVSGELEHIAVTRVPMNPRTPIELETKSMDENIVTRQDDAASIVGDEIAQALEEATTGTTERSLVQRSDTEQETPRALTAEEVAAIVRSVLAESTPAPAQGEEQIHQVSTEPATPLQIQVEAPVQDEYDVLALSLAGALRSATTPQTVDEVFAAAALQAKSLVARSHPAVFDFAAALQGALAPLVERLDSVAQRVDVMQAVVNRSAPVQQIGQPPRAAVPIVPNPTAQPQTVAAGKPSLREIVERSVYPQYQNPQ